MKGWLIAGGVLGGLILAAVLLVSSANAIPKKDEAVKAAWAEVENQYQQRGDLLLNLVETVKGAGDQETRSLIGTIHERASATKTEIPKNVINDPAAMDRLEAQQGQLGAAMGRLLVSMERYPDLKTAANYVMLQKKISDVERDIAVARRRYIAMSQNFNASIRTFPGNAWNKLFYELPPVVPLKADEGTRQRPNVTFRGESK